MLHGSSSPAPVERGDVSIPSDVEQLELQQQALEDALERNKLKLKQAKLKRKAELEDSAKKAHEVALGDGANAGDADSQCSVCFACTAPDKRIFMPCCSREGSATFTCSKCINVICRGEYDVRGTDATSSGRWDSVGSCPSCRAPFVLLPEVMVGHNSMNLPGEARLCRPKYTRQLALLKPGTCEQVDHCSNAGLVAKVQVVTTTAHVCGTGYEYSYDTIRAAAMTGISPAAAAVAAEAVEENVLEYEKEGGGGTNGGKIMPVRSIGPVV